MTRDNLWRSASRALFDSDLIATRVTLFFAELFWAIMLLWPGDTFGRPTYIGMKHIMPEEAWAIIFLISAATQISIVAMEDYSSRFARYFAAWNAVLWMYVGIISPLLSVYPPPAAMGGEFALALAAAWICLCPFILAVGRYRVRNLRNSLRPSA